MIPMATLSDTASTVTSTDNAPSFISSAPAMRMKMSQIMVFSPLCVMVYVVDGQKKSPRRDAKGT